MLENSGYIYILTNTEHNAFGKYKLGRTNETVKELKARYQTGMHKPMIYRHKCHDILFMEDFLLNKFFGANVLDHESGNKSEWIHYCEGLTSLKKSIKTWCEHFNKFYEDNNGQCDLEMFCNYCRQLNN